MAGGSVRYSIGFKAHRCQLIPTSPSTSRYSCSSRCLRLEACISRPVLVQAESWISSSTLIPRKGHGPCTLCPHDSQSVCSAVGNIPHNRFLCLGRWHRVIPCDLENISRLRGKPFSGHSFRRSEAPPRKNTSKINWGLLQKAKREHPLAEKMHVSTWTWGVLVQ